MKAANTTTPDTTKKKRGDARRQALVQAAASSFWIQGYAKSSLAQIAERAGVPLGNIYYYYKTKSDLAAAVADLFVNETESLLDSVRDETPEPRQRLKLFVQRLRATQDARLSHGCPITAAARDFREEAPQAADRAAESFSLLSGFVATELGRAGLRPSHSLSLARAVIAEWQGGIALAYALREPQILAETFVRIEQMTLTKT